MLDHSNWEAWTAVEETGINIYVFGEVISKGYKKHLLKKNIAGLPKNNLVLEIFDALQHTTDAYEELIYSEKIRDPKYYTLVSIFYKGRIIAEFECSEMISEEVEQGN